MTHLTCPVDSVRKSRKALSLIGKLACMPPILLQQLARKFDRIVDLQRIQAVNEYLNHGLEIYFWKQVNRVIIKGMAIEVQSEHRQMRLIGQFSGPLVAYILSVAPNIADISLLNGAEDCPNSTNAQRVKVLAMLSKNDHLPLKQLFIASDWCNRSASLLHIKMLVDKHRHTLEIHPDSLSSSEFWAKATRLTIIGPDATISDRSRTTLLTIPISDTAAIDQVVAMAVNISKVRLENGAGSSNAQRVKILSVLSKKDHLTLTRLAVESDWCNRAANQQLMKTLVGKHCRGFKSFSIDKDVMTNKADAGLCLKLSTADADPLIIKLLNGLDAPKVEIRFINGRCRSPTVILDWLHQLGATEVTLRNCSQAITGSEMQAYSTKKKLAVQTLKLIETDELNPFSRNAPVGRLRSVGDLIGLMPQLTAIDIEETVRTEKVFESAQTPMGAVAELAFQRPTALMLKREMLSQQLAESIAQTATVALGRYDMAPFAFKLTYRFMPSIVDMVTLTKIKGMIKKNVKKQGVINDEVDFRKGRCTISFPPPSSPNFNLGSTNVSFSFTGQR